MLAGATLHFACFQLSFCRPFQSFTCFHLHLHSSPLSPFLLPLLFSLSLHLCMTVSSITLSAHIHTLSRTLLSLQMAMIESISANIQRALEFGFAKAEISQRDFLHSFNITEIKASLTFLADVMLYDRFIITQDPDILNINLL